MNIVGLNVVSCSWNLGALGRKAMSVCLAAIGAAALASGVVFAQGGVQRPAADPAEIDLAPAESPLAAEPIEQAPPFSPFNEDRRNPAVCVLLITDRGPMVLEYEIEFAGRPFRERWNQLLNAALAATDTNGDDRFTWDEALRNPRFAPNAFGQTNAAAREAYLKRFDTNNDGLVDREEVDRFLQQFAPGGPLQFIGQPMQSFAQVITILDVDGDKALSADEIAQAGLRLKAVDANDDDILQTAELQRQSSGAAFRGGRTARPAPAILLNESVTSEAIFSALKQNCPADEAGLLPRGFALMPALFDQLDRNQDQRLTADETAEIVNIYPHLRLRADLAADGKSELSFIEWDRSLRSEPTATALGTSLTLSGVQLQFSVNKGATPYAYNYATIAANMIAQYDRDKNGYLEKNEVLPQMAATFASWDADNDGKVYAQEIEDAYNRQQLPRMSQTRLNVSVDPDPLLAVLDANGDGRLGARELSTAPQRLLSLDKNGDGQLSPEEIPQTLVLHLSSGNSFSASPVAVRTFQSPQPMRTIGEPRWFHMMDRNGDGDVTLREFPGTSEQFRQLDLNGDGFIDESEAKAAGK